LEQVGYSAVKGLNLETQRVCVDHKNDLKIYERPDTRSWIHSQEELSDVRNKLPLIAKSRSRDTIKVLLGFIWRIR
jgi:hypothetical protein